MQRLLPQRRDNRYRQRSTIKGEPGRNTQPIRACQNRQSETQKNRAANMAVLPPGKSIAELVCASQSLLTPVFPVRRHAEIVRANRHVTSLTTPRGSRLFGWRATRSSHRNFDLLHLYRYLK